MSGFITINITDIINTHAHIQIYKQTKVKTFQHGLHAKYKSD